MKKCINEFILKKAFYNKYYSMICIDPALQNLRLRVCTIKILKTVSNLI